jgi:hypothetical protein
MMTTTPTSDEKTNSHEIETPPNDSADEGPGRFRGMALAVARQHPPLALYFILKDCVSASECSLR